MPGTDIHTSSPEAKVSSLQKPYIMQQEDDLRGLEKVMQLMRGISVLFLLLHFYWFCYGWFDMHGCTLGVLDRLLRNVQRTTGLFTYSYLTKLFAAGFLALSCWGTRSVRSERITHRQILLAAAAGLLLFFFGDPLRHLPPQWAAPLYVAATSIGFLSLFLAGLWIGRLVKERLREDPFNDENESFMQETRLIENEYSAKIPLSRMISPQLYWVMTGNDFTLDINNPEDPKILCVGNNPDRQNIYSAALGLYNSRIVRLINKKGKLKSSIIIDELPTIYFRGLDNLIATARSNKVAVCLSFQDFSQLERDYGQEEAKVIENTVGNIFAGQVLGDTAKTLSERFGRIVQLRTSNSLSNDNLTTSTNTQLNSLIPASKISNLSQGMFVGAVADNFDERIEQKIFHAEIVIDREKLAGETASYVPIPEISSFRDADGVDRMEEITRRNYTQIKEDVSQIIKRELRRIAEDPALRHLLAKK